MIEIRAISPGAEPLRKSFAGARITIGRGDDNDLVLPDKSCSRNHAVVVCEKGVYRIVDLGSVNGISVEGKKVADALITRSLSVKLGETVLTFAVEDESLNRTVMLPDVANMTIQLGREQLAQREQAPDSAAAPVPPAPPPAPPPPPEPPAAREPAILYLNYREGQQDKSFRLVEGTEYVLGRSPNADVVLGDKRSSKRHAVISARDGSFFIRDQGSANKTFVNGTAVEESPLAIDDEIRIGDIVFRVARDRVRLDDEEYLMARTQLGLPRDALLREARAQAAAQEAPGEVVAPGSGPPWKLLAIVGTLVVLVIATAAWFLLGRGEPAASDQAAVAAPGQLRVEVAPVVAKELVFDVTATGSLKAERTSTVSAEVPGRVVDVLVDEGATVTQGQELARLNDRDVRLQIEEARSSLTPDQVKIAKDDYDRKKRLFESGVITRSVFDQSKNNYLALESNYQALQAKIKQLGEMAGKTRIMAPIAATVVRRTVSPGEFVGPGTPLFVLDSMGEMLLEAEVSDRDVVKLHQGQAVEVGSDAFPGRTWNGVVDLVGSAANPVTKTFKVQARIPNPDGSLRSGMIASLRIVLETASGLVVPARALIGDDGKDKAEVFVVDGGRARRAAVTVGRRLDRDVQVLEGLAAGQTVVIYGQERLSDGTAVETYTREEG